MTTSPASVPTNPLLIGNLACTVSMLIWAIGFPLADEILKVMQPLSLATIRTGIAALFLLLVWGYFEGFGGLRAAHWRRGMTVGALSYSSGAVLLVVAQLYTDGITTSVILASMPIFAIALECLLDGRRLSRSLILGLALSLTGGMAVYATRMGDLSLGWGALAALGSVLVFAWGSRASVTWLPGHTALARTALPVIGAGLTLAAIQPLVIWGGGEALPLAHTAPKIWAYLAVYAIVSMALSQLFFLIGVARLGIGISSMHLNVAPFYVMICSLAFGATWSWAEVVGAALVGAGVYIAQRR